MTNYRLISHKELDRMYHNGWRLRHIKATEKTEQVVQDMQTYTNKIKVYQITTDIRGYYQHIIAYKI